MKEKNEKKITFAKLLTIACFCQFFYVFYICSNYITSVSDYTVVAFYTATIGISGTITISSIIWYMKKSASEKGSQFQIKNLKDILELKADPKYNSNLECMDLLNGAEQDTINRATNLVNNFVDEANISPEIETNKF